MDREQVAKLAEPNPEFAKFLENNPPPNLDWHDVPKFRAIRGEMQRQATEALGPPGPHVEEEYRTVKMRDGFESQIKIHRPVGKSGGPLVVLCFGGGFIVGDNEQLTPFARGFARAFGAVVVNISYRLAPDHKFPAAPQDAWDTLQWIDKNVESLGADPSKGFILGGISAGGNLTAVLAQKAQDEGILSHPLTGLWLSVPLVFPVKDLVPDKYKNVWFAHEQNAEAPVLNKKAIDAVGEHLEPDAYSPLYSPFNTKTPHKGLPPCYFQVNGMDPLRDDGLIYEQVLREHGVKTKIDIWPGLPHAHFAMMPFLECSKSALYDTFVGFGWLLGAEVSPELVKGVMAAPGGA